MIERQCKRICLYDGMVQPWFSVERVREHLERWLPWLQVEVRGGLMASGEGGPLADMLCQTRVRSPFQAPAQRRPLKPEIDYEARVLAGEVRPASGVTYDGNDLQRIAFTRLPRGERGADAAHVWFTERLFGTWEEDDRRYHLRVILCGRPSIISSTGMVQAPAKPREFYIARRLGVSTGRLPGASSSDCLQFEDPRITDAAKGYAMQAAMFALTGEPFCDDPACRLFNAHWQAEMLNAQLEGRDYCARHEEMFDAWAAGREEKG